MKLPARDDIPVETLREMLEYDPETGVLRWKNYIKHLSGRVAGVRHKSGYIRIKIKGFPYVAHRLAWAIHFGEWPDGLIDHVDCNGLNNAISNLRLATYRQNQHNTGLRSDNTSGFKGVYFHKQTRKWNAQVKIGKTRKSLGLFATPSEAHEAYKAAARKYYEPGFHRVR